MALIFTAMDAGFKANWLIWAVSVSALSVGLVLLEFEERRGDARGVALVGVMVALVVASRQFLHGIEFSPVFFLVILAGRAFGATIGFTVGSLSMFISNFFLGHGPWTQFQMLAMGLTGGAAAILPRAGRLELAMLAVYSVVAAFAYGLMTDVFFWMAFIPTHSTESFIGIVAAGMPANSIRAAGNVFFMALMGPLLIRDFRRFSGRFRFERAD